MTAVSLEVVERGDHVTASLTWHSQYERNSEPILHPQTHCMLVFLYMYILHTRHNCNIEYDYAVFTCFCSNKATSVQVDAHGHDHDHQHQPIESRSCKPKAGEVDDCCSSGSCGTR